MRRRHRLSMLSTLRILDRGGAAMGKDRVRMLLTPFRLA